MSADKKSRLPPSVLIWFGGFLSVAAMTREGSEQILLFILGANWFCAGYLVKEIRAAASRNRENEA